MQRDFIEISQTNQNAQNRCAHILKMGFPVPQRESRTMQGNQTLFYSAVVWTSVREAARLLQVAVLL